MSEESPPQELKVTLVGDTPHAFVVEIRPGSDAATLAKGLVDNGAWEKHEDQSFTIYPAAQIASVTVQARGTGPGRPATVGGFST